MRCAWQDLLRIIPPWMRQDVDKLGREHLQELRLRTGQPPQLCLHNGIQPISGTVSREDLQYCVNMASQYSPWSAATAADGYITAKGGHRVGICGSCVIQDGAITGIRTASSLCIRVARDFPGLAARIRPGNDSILIIGSPGTGKTTLLRDLIRQISGTGRGSVGVVDERGELFSNGMLDSGQNTDLLTGCQKLQGISMLLRTMGPAWIAVDEITQDRDCEALIQAGWCGVKLLATAHASSKEDLLHRPVYQLLSRCGLFRQLIVMHPDKSYHMERMNICT